MNNVKRLCPCGKDLKNKTKKTKQNKTKKKPKSYLHFCRFAGDAVLCLNLLLLLLLCCFKASYFSNKK